MTCYLIRSVRYVMEGNSLYDGIKEWLCNSGEWLAISLEQSTSLPKDTKSFPEVVMRY